MIDWSLSGSPLSVSIWNRGALRKYSGQSPVEEIWIIDECFGVDWLVVHDNGSGILKTSAESLHHEKDDPCICQPASDIEVLDGEFSDEH